MNWLPLIYKWLWSMPKADAFSHSAHEAPIHGLRGLLYTLAPNGLEAHINEKARLRNIAHHLQVEQTLSQYWPAHITKPLVMKGFDYTLNLYPDLGLRHSNDIDLLVNPDQFEPVTRHLSQYMAVRTPPTENKYRHEGSSAITFEVSGITLDLHQTPVMRHQTRLNTTNILKRSNEGKLGNCDVLFPHRLDRLYLWLHNFTKHFQPVTMHSLVDLVLILKTLMLNQPNSDWSNIHVQCADKGLGPSLELALTYLEDSGLWLKPLPITQGQYYKRNVDRWLRVPSNQGVMATVLKGIMLINRTVPEGRIAVAKRLLNRIYK